MWPPVKLDIWLNEMHKVTSEQGRHELIIIGGGASGILLAWNLARELGRPVSLVEPAGIMGLGLAYATPSLDHILNVPAHGMSASATDGGHFLAWLRRRIDPQAEAGCFVARAVYGLYLRELALESGTLHIRGRVESCRRQGADWQLALDDGRHLRAGQIVLALGHFEPRPLRGAGSEGVGLPCYAADAWGPELYSALQPDDKVVLIGTGLTMVDALVRLRQRGHRGQVVAVSGHALLPQRHAPYQALAAPAIQPGTGPASVRAYLQAFHRSLRSGAEWRAVVDSLRPVSNALWLALDDTQKHRFRRHLQRRWDVLRHRMAPQVADQLADELASGRMQVMAGRVEAIRAEAGQRVLSLVHGGRPHELRADRVINCSGPGLDYRHSGSVLLQSMLAAGDIAPGFAGAGLACDARGQLLNARGQPTPGLHVIGPARLGCLFESVAIPELKQQAHDLAKRLARVQSEPIALEALAE